METRDRRSVVYICWSCGEDFEVTERDGLADSLEVSCPDCGSDLVAVDFAVVRHGATDRRRRGSAVDLRETSRCDRSPRRRSSCAVHKPCPPNPAPSPPRTSSPRLGSATNAPGLTNP